MPVPTLARLKRPGAGTLRAVGRASLPCSALLAGLALVVASSGCSADPDGGAPVNGGSGGGSGAVAGGLTNGGMAGSTSPLGGAAGSGPGGVGAAGTTTGGAAGHTAGAGGGAAQAGAAQGGAAQGGAAQGGAAQGGAAQGGATGGVSAGGAGGSPATAGAPNGGSGGGAAVVRTPGCGTPTTAPTGKFNPYMLDVGGTSRQYFVHLPANYDPMRAYTLVFQFHGAGSTGTSTAIPIHTAAGADAIVVGGTAEIHATEKRTQWQFSSATSPDVAFFDAMLLAVGNAYCVDKSRVFAVGYSSGGWMCNLLGCVRPGVLRGYGVVAGGLGGGGKACAPEGVAAWFLHDQDDPENAISGNQRARDRLLTVNGCSMTTLPVEPAPCVRYQGCRSGLPVDWCQSTGKGHSSQGSLSGPGMWRFFSSL